MEKDMFIYIFLLSQISLGLIIPGKGPVYNPLAEFPEIESVTLKATESGS